MSKPITTGPLPALRGLPSLLDQAEAHAYCCHCHALLKSDFGDPQAVSRKAFVTLRVLRHTAFALVAHSYRAAAEDELSRPIPAMDVSNLTKDAFRQAIVDVVAKSFWDGDSTEASGIDQNINKFIYSESGSSDAWPTTQSDLFESCVWHEIVSGLAGGFVVRAEPKETSEDGFDSPPEFRWTRSYYRAQKAARKYSEETNADY